MNIEVDEKSLAYKRGFVDGKSITMQLLTIGKVLIIKEEDPDDVWYNYGKEDAYNFYSEQIINGVSFEKVNDNKALNECFLKRISKDNSEISTNYKK